MTTFPINTCGSCKHLDADNKMFGLPLCNLYGFPLTKSDPTDDELVLAFGTIGGTCPSFEAGMATTTGSAKTRPIIGIPLPEVTAEVRVEMRKTSRPKPRSCTECTFYVMPSIVNREHGFVHGVCSAKAELVHSSQLVIAAKDCPMGTRGMNAAGTGIRLDDRYNPMAVVDAARKVRAAQFDPFRHASIDPTEWETELPVTDTDAASGVRAWRLVEHPKGDRNPIAMPIFDWTHPALGIKRDPCESYGEHRPELYVDHAGLLYAAAFMMMGGIHHEAKAINRAMVLIGEAGTGKTEFWCYFAWLMGLPFHRLSLRPDTESDEFFGQTALVIDPETGQNVTQFNLGRFTRAYTEPGVICLDEPNAASDSIWFLLRPALDNAGQLVIEAEDKVFKRHPLCFIGLAMNPAWNPTYRGTRPLSGADSNRLAKRWVSLPDETTERKIIQSHCEDQGYDIPEGVLDTIMRIGKELRGMEAETGLSWGIRPQVAVAVYTMGFEVEEAYALAVLDELEPELRDVVAGVIRSNISSKRPASRS